ncbi:hypothetical protein [Budvicia aquatica]|uniref:Uncharacterized protein n=2 Tax=Budvicia aquatica TaxID=82979 RepID=A0A2C6DRT7_9GAMM|nr:hypothetical protein [Budvicia aquatica]PHI31175.1 hypothetical protein CRN84_18430 [Budvicia aquatica]VFS51435.1 Uncharacterised protein [Budvicia aquatica]
MSNYNDKIYLAMRRAEATGGLGGSALANEIIAILKPYYQGGDESIKVAIVNRIKELKKQPGVGFSIDYLKQLSN